MASFGWAYVDCTDVGPDVAGPTGSVQFLTGTNALSGTINLMYHTAAVHGYAANTLVLTGALVISGAISASSYHIKNISEIHSSGSSYFGNSADDIHARTGSLDLYSNSARIYTIESSAGNISGSGTLHNVGAATFSSTIASTGSITATSFAGGSITATTISASSTLQAVGATILGNTLAVSGASTLAGSTSAQALTATTLSASSTLQAVGATTLGGTLSVSGSTTLAGSTAAQAVTATTISGSGALTVTSISASGESHFSGNLGIGLTSPLYDLHVNGPGATVVAVDAGSGADAYLRFLTNHVEKSYIKQGSGGNLLVVNQGTGGEIKFSCDNSVETLSMSDSDLSGSTTLHMVGATTLGSTLATSGSVTAGSHVVPATDNNLNLGSPAKRWANLYTGDLHLKNDRGDWTVVEEEDYLCVINNKTGKKFKMALIPIGEDE